MEPGFSFIDSFDPINVLPKARMDHDSSTFESYLVIIMKRQDRSMGAKLEDVHTMKA
jgi:hypothetical protein